MNTKDFIEKASMLYNNKYDYSLVKYINSNTKIKIICPEHGEFEQIPASHLRGNECRLCGISNAIIKKSSTNINFIKRADIIHNNKYNYSLTEYKHSKTKVIIICPVHGEFEQTPNAHLKGQNCPHCNIELKYLTNKTFIEKAHIIHDKKYDYSLVNYIDKSTKIKIICPKHGVFKQQPTSHLKNHGCPICCESKGEKEVANYLNSKRIEYIREYIFNDCKNIKPLPFDFYIPSINTCIEYDGRQHYIINEYFGGEKGYMSIVNRDKIKTNYCEDNGIKLIRIKYNQDIKHILMERGVVDEL